MSAVSEVPINWPDLFELRRERERTALDKLKQYQRVAKLRRTQAVFIPEMSVALRHVQDHESLFAT